MEAITGITVSISILVIVEKLSFFTDLSSFIFFLLSFAERKKNISITDKAITVPAPVPTVPPAAP